MVAMVLVESWVHEDHFKVYYKSGSTLSTSLEDVVKTPLIRVWCGLGPHGPPKILPKGYNNMINIRRGIF